MSLNRYKTKEYFIILLCELNRFRQQDAVAAHGGKYTLSLCSSEQSKARIASHKVDR
jgi:hypothetical protein